MRTRIRELRKLRGLTLKQLADRVGTTAQTIQRLELASMTVSTSWLEKIAPVLGVTPSELLSSGGIRNIPFLGKVGLSGIISRSENEATTLPFDIPAQDPVAVRLDQAIGPYQAGMILIASKLKERDFDVANGTDCLIGFEAATVLLRRVYYLAKGSLLLAPLDAGSKLEEDSKPNWLARVVMSARYNLS